MTDEQFAQIMTRLDDIDTRIERLETNSTLTNEGVRLVCAELGIRERLTEIVTKLSRNGHVHPNHDRVKDTIPAPPGALEDERDEQREGPHTD